MKHKRTQPWQLQEAKAKFSEVFDLALKGEPQTVTRHGKDAVVVVSRNQYNTLRNGSPIDPFVSFLLSGPKIEGGIPIPQPQYHEPRVDFSDPEWQELDENA